MGEVYVSASPNTPTSNGRMFWTRWTAVTRWRRCLVREERERERGEILTLSPKRTVAFLCKQQKMTDVFMIVYMNKKHQTHVDRFVVRSSFECF